jgi:hypothetical protein
MFQRATCNVQRATCNVRRATCNVQRASCNVRRATSNVQRPTCARATCSRATCTHVLTCDVQHSTARRRGRTVGRGPSIATYCVRHGGGVDMAKANRQTSNKAGLASLGQKRENARHGFRPQPASRKSAGASGQEGRGAVRQGRSSNPKGGKTAALRGMKTSR